MKISILDSEKMDLTDAVRDYLQNKIDMLDKFVHNDDESVDMKVIIGRQNNHHNKGNEVYFCELNLHMAGKDFNLKADEADLYSAIDAAKDEMARVLSQYKDKKSSFVKRGGAKVKEFLRGFKG